MRVGVDSNDSLCSSSVESFFFGFDTSESTVSESESEE